MRTGCLHISKHTRVPLIQQLGFLKGKRQRASDGRNEHPWIVQLCICPFSTVIIRVFWPSLSSLDCVCVHLFIPYNGGVMKGSLDSFWIRSLSLFLSLSNKSPDPVWDPVIVREKSHFNNMPIRTESFPLRIDGSEPRHQKDLPNVTAGQSFQCDLLIWLSSRSHLHNLKADQCLNKALAISRIRVFRRDNE